MTVTDASRPMLMDVIPEDRAWRGPALSPSRDVLTIPDDCLAELLRTRFNARHLVRLWLRAGDRRQCRG